MPASAWNDLEPLLEVSEYRKGEPLVRQGSTNMEQFFILDGILKRVVSNPQGKEMILRFAAETDMDTDRKSTRLNSSHLVISYAVFCLKKKNIGRPTTATASNVSYLHQRWLAHVQVA